MIAKECNNLYGELIRENIQLKAKLKQEQERRFTIMKQTIKKIFDDIWRKYIENADLGGDCLSFSEDVFIPCKKKWVGKE